MKRVEYIQYGGPEVLMISEVAKPNPLKDEILVKVMASSMNAVDWKNRQGRLRFVSGLLKLVLKRPVTKPRVKQGFDVAGLVEGVGYGVSGIQASDMVLGQLGNFQGGAFAQCSHSMSY